MQSTLNTDLLASKLKISRANRGLRAVADEIGGVSAATLSRIEQGKVPDVATFIKICNWLDETTDTFIVSNSTGQKAEPVSTQQLVIAHLRADRELSKETINTLISVIDLAYNTK